MIGSEEHWEKSRKNREKQVSEKVAVRQQSSYNEKISNRKQKPMRKDRKVKVLNHTMRVGMRFSQ